MKQKGKKLGEIINELLAAIRAAGVAVPDNVAREVEVHARREFGGERIYIPSLPKQARAVQIAKLNKMDDLQVAQRTGLSIRQVRRIKRGR